MIFTLLILAIGGFLSPILCKSSYWRHKPLCVLGGVLEEEWDRFDFTIIDCGPINSCEPTMLELLPTIGKYLG